MTRTPLRVGLAGLALSLLAAHGACAQDDAPPADLLSHVKVGQRWTLRTVQGEEVVEEVQTVAEVRADRVVYLVTLRFMQDGKLVFENAVPDPTEWVWSGGPRQQADPAALALAKMRQERRVLEVPGMKLDCVVLITSEPASETWIPVKGDHETYPGPARAMIGEQPFRSLVKVEEGPAPTLRPRAAEEDPSAGPPAGAFDHVKVGQRWVFRQDVDETTTTELTWTIVAVAPAEGLVRYRVKTVTRYDEETQTYEEEEPSEWSAGGSPVLEEGLTITGVTTARKKLELPGLTLDCYVVTHRPEGEDPVEGWTAVKGKHEVFPGVVKHMVGKQVALQLVRVEQP